MSIIYFIFSKNNTNHQIILKNVFIQKFFTKQAVDFGIFVKLSIFLRKRSVFYFKAKT
jgi:hypothetical protein